MTRKKSYFLDHLLGAALGSSYVATLLMTVSGLGYSRDEGFYFQAASSYASWFQQLLRAPSEALTRGAIDSAWNVNHEHPALVKSLFALSWLFLHKKWHLFTEEGTAFRFGGMVFAGVGIWLLYIWGTRVRSRACGVMAAALFGLMPRVFYHSHLDCFDIPITVMWLLCTYVYWRAVDTGKLRWALATGIVFGLALNTKHNAWFLPFGLIIHNLIARFDVYRRDLKRGFLPISVPLVAMATIGPLVFVGLWPWLWADTVERLGGYFLFHLHHDYYNIVFLGQTYWKPPFPWSYIWIMTVATVPTITLVLFAIGLWRVLLQRRRLPFWPYWSVPLPRRDDSSCTGWLWVLGIAAMYAPWVLSRTTPIFGGTKHWMPAYPFMCLFAGVGFDALATRLSAWLAEARQHQSYWMDISARAGLGGCLILAPLAETVHSHPWGLSNYTPLVGGASGAASLGLNRQFWGFTTGAVVDYLNDNVKAGDSVFIHDTAWPSWEMLVHDGRLRAHVRPAGSIEQSEFALYHHEEHMEGVEYQIWAAYGTASPVHIGTYDGVPIVYVYRRPR